MNAHAQTASASIQVAVAQPQPVAAGANFDYVVNISNEGPADAANITLSFPLPSGVSFQSVSVPAGWTCNAIAPGTMGATVTCSAAALSPGTASITITASTPPTASGTYTTTATISSSTPDPSTNDNSAEVSVIVSTQSDYSMALAASPNPVNAGSNLTLTMTVTNNGPSTGSDASVSLPLPIPTTFVSISAPPGWSCTTPAAGANGVVTCSLTASMNPATTATFTVLSHVAPSTPSGTPISTTATISSASDFVPANDTADASVQSAALYDLGITKTYNDGPAPNTKLSRYTIVVTNAGPSDAPAVTMTDVLSAPLSFDFLFPAVFWTCSSPAPSQSGTVSCSIPSMAAGSSATFTLFVFNRATPGTTVSNTASVASTPQDTNASNNSSTATMVVTSPPNVTATKSVGGGATHPEGSLVTYTIVLTNTGTLPQNDNPGNELTDILPSSLTLGSATASSGTATANTASNTVTWNGTIAGGSSVTITIQAWVNNGTSGTTISNTATVSYDSDGNGTNDATRSSDDPTTAAPGDATSFQVVGVVPALSTMMLALLAAVLTCLSLLLMRQ